MSRVLVSDEGRLHRAARVLPRALQTELLFAHQVARWFRDEGDATHRLHYPELGKDSLVFDLGGYKGQFASDIFSKYCCAVYVFEPFESFAAGIQERFRLNERIAVFPFGLGGRDETRRIYFHDDGTSVFRPSSAYEEITIRRFSTFVRERDIARIDLLKINIEGSEYDLLDDIIQSGLQHRIRNIQVQFHRDIERAQDRMTAIQLSLLETHDLTYAYPFVWENYRLRA